MKRTPAPDRTDNVPPLPPCVVLVALPPKDGPPERRTDFVYADITRCVLERTRDILNALLGMVESRMDAGRPGSSGPPEGFESGVDAEVLIEAWAKKFGTWQVKATQILGLVKENELFPMVTGRKEEGQAAALAKSVLKPLAERPVGAWQVVRTTYGRSTLYRLTPTMRRRPGASNDSPAAVGEAVHDFEELGSPVTAFIRDRCRTGPEVEIECGKLYDAWREWCSERGWDRPTTAATFGRDLRSALPGLRDIEHRAMGLQYRAYAGIALLVSGGKPPGSGEPDKVDGHLRQPASVGVPVTREERP